MKENDGPRRLLDEFRQKFKIKKWPGKTPPSAEWEVIGTSVPGAIHVQKGIPNQDAIKWFPKKPSKLPIILAVSDGHGSSFRGGEGAQIAVDVSTQILHEFVVSQSGQPTLSTIKRTAEERIPKEIVHAWREAVKDDMKIRPFSEEDRKQLNLRPGSPEETAVSEDDNLDTNLDTYLDAYGATILAVVVAEIKLSNDENAKFIIYLQLGDGDILTVSDSGEVTRPLPDDARLFANETTSLCAKQAWNDFRFRLQLLTESVPALILLSTDGYANSFQDDAGFQQVGKDILHISRKYNLGDVDDDLASWLAEASQAGSGDDITLGIICYLKALN